MPKLTSAITLEFVTRIEGLTAQISEVYREACENYGASSVNAIREIVQAREEANDQRMLADGLLAALDEEDED